MIVREESDDETFTNIIRAELHREEDLLDGPMRGLVFGLLFAIPSWVFIGLGIWLAMR